MYGRARHGAGDRGRRERRDRVAWYDDDAKSVLSWCTVGFAPYTARLTYRFRPPPEVAVFFEDGFAQVRDTDRPLTSLDYEFVVFGGLDETNDMRRVRRDVALKVLHALRDAESDLQTWRRNPLRDLLERLPLDAANLTATAAVVALAVDQLAQDPNVGTLRHASKSDCPQWSGRACRSHPPSVSRRPSQMS